MRLDDSLKLAGQILSAHLQQTAVPEERLAEVLANLHRDVMRMQAGTYAAWQIELPQEILEQAELDKITPRSYPPAKHPLAAEDVSVEDRIAGTVHDTAIECLECGRSVKLLKSHILGSHNRMTWDEYLERHQLPDTYPAAPRAHVDRQRADQMRIHHGIILGDQDGDDADGQKKSQLVSPDFSRPGASDADADADSEDALGKTG